MNIADEGALAWRTCRLGNRIPETCRPHPAVRENRSGGAGRARLRTCWPSTRIPMLSCHASWQHQYCLDPGLLGERQRTDPAAYVRPDQRVGHEPVRLSTA